MNAGIIQILENEAANSERRELLRKARAEFDRFAAGIGPVDVSTSRAANLR